MKQSGGITGPNDAITHYNLEQDPNDDNEYVITFGSEERPGVSPMYVGDLRRHIHQPYNIPKPENGWRKVDSFSDEEKKKLRPIAETLAMLDGNAFFGGLTGEDPEWYESYLPEADALYERNGGDNGWSGQASFVKK